MRSWPIVLIFWTKGWLFRNFRVLRFMVLTCHVSRRRQKTSGSATSVLVCPVWSEPKLNEERENRAAVGWQGLWSIAGSVLFQTRPTGTQLFSRAGLPSTRSVTLPWQGFAALTCHYSKWGHNCPGIILRGAMKGTGPISIFLYSQVHRNIKQIEPNAIVLIPN